MRTGQLPGPSPSVVAANSGKLSHFIITQKKFAKVEDLKGGRVGIVTA